MIQARPTTYNGIPMRSRLEASWAAALDAEGWEWIYEPRAYASPAGQYLPDFEITSLALPVFVEVKGHLDMGDLLEVLGRMEIILVSVPTAMLWLFVGPPDDFVLFDRDKESRWAIGSRAR